MQEQSTQFAISAVGRDRPGIIAALTQFLYKRGCNLADVNMSLLNGQFAMVLVAASEQRLVSAELEKGLAEAMRSFDLTISVSQLSEPRGRKDAGPEGEHALVSVYGIDRPGIVHAVSYAIAATGSNIVDLRTRAGDGDASRPPYAVFLEVDLGTKTSVAALREALAAGTNELGLQLRVEELGAAEL